MVMIRQGSVMARPAMVSHARELEQQDARAALFLLFFCRQLTCLMYNTVVYFSPHLTTTIASSYGMASDAIDSPESVWCSSSIVYFVGKPRRTA